MDTPRIRYKSDPLPSPAPAAPPPPASSTVPSVSTTPPPHDELEIYRERPIEAMLRLALTRTSTVAVQRPEEEVAPTPLEETAAPDEPAAVNPDEEKVEAMIARADRWDADKLTDELFHDRHPEMNGKKPAPGSAEAREWTDLKARVVEPRIAAAVEKRAADVVTSWSGKDILGDSNEMEDADQIFFERHPELKDQALKAGSAEAKEWMQIYKEVIQNKHNDTIKEAVKEFPGLHPKVLKSLLITESQFKADNVSPTGATGIAQFIKKSARGEGLKVDDSVDERLDPEKAIHASARHLLRKAKYLESHAFKKYGQPTGDEYWKFVLAAYNAGEGVVELAMKHAYQAGLEEATRSGLTGDAATEYAKTRAGTWDNLVQSKNDLETSPLYQGLVPEYHSGAKNKYKEVDEYPVSIIKRARQ